MGDCPQMYKKSAPYQSILSKNYEPCCKYELIKVAMVSAFSKIMLCVPLSIQWVGCTRRGVKIWSRVPCR